MAIMNVSQRKQAEQALRRANEELDARVRQRTAELEAANTTLRAEITERRRLEDELRARMAELDEAHRRKDEFLAMLSHELRNPLAPLGAGQELLKSGKLSPDRTKATLEMMDRQFGHLVRLVNDLLDVSRVYGGKIRLDMRKTDVRAIVRQAAEACRIDINRRRHQLELNLPDEAVWVEADETRLQQVVLNLLNNAAKYTEAGTVGVVVALDAGEVRISVTDTGRGISPELLPRIFDLFTQGDESLDRADGGLGIGLALVRRLVQMHGGRVEAHSAGRGEGSEFTVHLPLTTPENPARQAPELVSVPAAEVQIAWRVLVVDDNQDTARSTVSLLEHWGHEAKWAGDGPSALDAARTFQPDFVLLDIGLPGMDGYEVARSLRDSEAGKRARLIAVTGYGREEDKARTQEAGFDEHLVKPVRVDVLQRILSQGPGDGLPTIPGPVCRHGRSA